jgi:hypothetical protein
MERSLSVNLKQLADKLTTELTYELQYVVTDNVQLYDETTKLGGDEYTPVLLTLIASFENENRYIRNLTYQLTFKVRDEDIDKFYIDVDRFRTTQSTEVIDSYVVTKTVQNAIYTLSTVDNGIDYKEFTLDFIWVWNLSKVGTNAIIKVDTVSIPFTQCDVIHDIAYITNEAQATNYRMTNDTITLEVPLIVSNTKVASLYADINADTYNKTYVLDIDGVSKTVVLKKGQYTYTKTSAIVGMILTFETHYPRVLIELDGEALPISAYQYQSKLVMVNAARTEAIVKAYGTSKVRTWSITFIKKTSNVWNKLISDAYGNYLDTTYLLTVGSETFTVGLSDVVESFTETGDMTLQCQFQEYAN